MTHFRLFATLAVALLAILAAAPAAVAHSGHEHALVDHQDPRQELPDSLVTQSVAQAELTTLEPPSFGSGSDPETWCGTETTANDTANAVVAAGAPHLKLIYAYASDQPNRFDMIKDRLQATVSLLNRYLASQSGGRKALRWDMGTPCGPQYVDIQVVPLPGTRASYVPGGAPSFNATRGAVSAAIGGIGAPRNLVIYADGLFGTNGTAGVASRYTTSDSTTTAHDGGGLAAVVFGPQTLPSSAYAWPTVMLHEIGHNLGAVQDDSPHSTLAGHCFDESDVMCYADGGPDGQPSDMTATCDALGGDMNETLDCGGDDYFNPMPAQGSYLDEHWNVYGVAHLGPCSAELAERCGLAGAAVDGTKPTNTTPVPALVYRNTWAPTISGADSESAVDRFQWRLNAGAIQNTATPVVPGADGVQQNLYTRVRDAAGNWSTWRWDPVYVDTTAPAVTVTCPAAWSTAVSAPQCTYSVTSAGSTVASVETQKGSEVVVAGAAGGALDATADAQVIRVRAMDGVGNTSEWVQDTARWDRVTPTASVTCPSAWGAASTTCHVDASDAGSGIQTVTWRVGAGSATTVAPGSDFIVGTPGAQTITVDATDAAGRAQTATATSRVEATPPDVTVDCENGWQADSATCTVTGSDDESGLDSLTWTTGDGPTQLVESGDTITVDTHGDHTVTAVATNNVNMPTAGTDTARVDTTAPTGVAVSCPDAWQTIGSCTVAATDPESGVATRRAKVGSGDAADLAAGAVSVTAGGVHEVIGQAVNAVGRVSAWSAPATVRVDAAIPLVSLSCTMIGDGRHSCTPQASDAHSGLATLRLLRDGVTETVARAPGAQFEATGPATVAMTATDAVGRAATSAPLILSGPAPTTEPAPPLPAPISPLVPPAPPAPIAPLTARAVAKLPGSGSGVLEVNSLGGKRQAAVTISPGKLKVGVYQLKICIKGGECRAKTVKLRKAGRPAAMRAQLPAPAGEVRATFTISKKAGRRFKHVATASTSVQLG